MTHSATYLRNHLNWTDETFQVLYQWWGSAHGEAKSDPMRLQTTSADDRTWLTIDMKRHLDTDEGPAFHVYNDMTCGWDSTDPIAYQVRVIFKFLSHDYTLDFERYMADTAQEGR